MPLLSLTSGAAAAAADWGAFVPHGKHGDLDLSLQSSHDFLGSAALVQLPLRRRPTGRLLGSFLGVDDHGSEASGPAFESSSSLLSAALKSGSGPAGPRGGRAQALASSFFDPNDLAPQGGLPPPDGWGGGNDSKCETCACDSRLLDKNEENIYVRPMVIPNVPHHAFYPHTTTYRVGHFKLFLLFLIGAGSGYAATYYYKKQYGPKELRAGEELAGSPIGDMTDPS
eukprot:gb/GFBE01065988.1/.p1 GENE.gb/GFBE01065988.1/~~gb/GFBE01065988.1/.p1  ORF type:complete len:227 (+),score=34.57 gb/GFBE01065988.1/:1-681(+)